MTQQSASRPVRRFQVSTRDEAEAEEFIRQIYIGNRSRFHGAREDARFTVTAAEAAGISASHVRSTMGYSAVTDPFGYFLFIAIRNGRLHVQNGRDETIQAAGDMSFYPVGVPLEVEASDLGVRSLALPAARLEAVAEETAGIAAADLRFEATAPVSAAMARQWSAFMDLASDLLLADDSPVAHPLLAEELARTAAITALHTFPSTAMTVSYCPGPGWAAPVTVRRAAGFLEAHADQPVAPGQVAEAAGATGRALRHAFRRYYGITPAGYLRRIRLERARRELQAADPGSGVTIAAVARRWGWASPAQFTAAYQQRFGQLPSCTLRTGA